MAGMDGGWIPMESSSQLCLLNISFEELKVEVGRVVLDGPDILIIMHYSVWSAMLSSGPAFLNCSPVSLGRKLDN